MPSAHSERDPCSRCGGTARTTSVELTATIRAWADMRGIAFSLGSKSRRFVTLFSGWVWQRTRQVWGHRLMMVDKRNDRYLERVVAEQTGEVLHSCEVKLTQHRGHGSAKAQQGRGE